MRGAQVAINNTPDYDRIIPADAGSTSRPSMCAEQM